MSTVRQSGIARLNCRLARRCPSLRGSTQSAALALAFVPIVLAAQILQPKAHTLLFVLSVVAIVPLAALFSHATESVATRTGDAIGGLLNATLGNLTELLIALTALRAGQYVLVKASIAGAIVTNALFMLGAALLVGGLKHHVQEYNRDRCAPAGRPAVPRDGRDAGSVGDRRCRPLPQPAVHPHAEPRASRSCSSSPTRSGCCSRSRPTRTVRQPEHARGDEAPWPIGLALATLAGVTVLVALVSEMFVESVQQAAATFGMTPAFVGFIVVALVGGAAEMASAFSAARKNRLDLSVGIALGSASQIALFVAPVLVLLSYVIGPTPMDLQFWPGAVVMMLIATMTAALVTNSGRSAWFVGVLVLMVYLIFAMTLYLLPPRVS